MDANLRGAKHIMQRVMKRFMSLSHIRTLVGQEVIMNGLLAGFLGFSLVACSSGDMEDSVQEDARDNIKNATDNVTDQEQEEQENQEEKSENPVFIGTDTDNVHDTFQEKYSGEFSEKISEEVVSENENDSKRVENHKKNESDFFSSSDNVGLHSHDSDKSRDKDKHLATKVQASVQNLEEKSQDSQLEQVSVHEAHKDQQSAYSELVAQGDYLQAVLSLPEPSEDSSMYLLYKDVLDLQNKKLAIRVRESARYPCRALFWSLGVGMMMHINYDNLIADFSLDFVKDSLKYYMKYLDPEKIYFLKKDEEMIMSQLAERMESELPLSECDSVKTVSEIYMKRFIDILPMVYHFISLDHDYSIKEYLSLSKYREYAESTADLEDRVRKLMKFHFQHHQKRKKPKDSAEDILSKVLLPFHQKAQEVKDFSTFDAYDAYLSFFGYMLDSHSMFLNHERGSRFNSSLARSLVGIGVQLSITDEALTIEHLFSGASADKDGTLKRKDQIIAVRQDDPDAEWEYVKDYSSDHMMSVIVGEKGTKVELKIRRPILVEDSDDVGESHLDTVEKDSAYELFDLTLVRSKVLQDNIMGVPYHTTSTQTNLREESVKVGYLVFNNFYYYHGSGKGVSDDFVQAMEAMAADGMDSLVIDLRKNSGGYTYVALKILASLMEAEVLLYEKGRNLTAKPLQNPAMLPTYTQALSQATSADLSRGSLTHLYPFKEVTSQNVQVESRRFHDLPVVVLVGSVSASAAEIVSHAIKVNGRGIVVGDKHTYGKGSVQKMIPVPLFGMIEGKKTPIGSSLKVTTSQFFGSNGQSVQNVGVESDILLPSLSYFQVDFSKHDSYSLPYAALDRKKYDKSLSLRFRDPSILDSLRELSAARRTPNSVYSKAMDWFYKKENRKSKERLIEESRKQIALYTDSNMQAEEQTAETKNSFEEMLRENRNDASSLSRYFEDSSYTGDRSELFQSMMDKDYVLKEAMSIAADYYVLCRGDAKSEKIAETQTEETQTEIEEGSISEWREGCSNHKK